MMLPDFKVEQWMNDYEGQAIYNLTDTCTKPLSMKALLEMENTDFDHILLDYGQITGDIELKKHIIELYTTGSLDNVTTCHGCLEANQLVMETLLEAGNHVIACVPGYQQFYEVPKSIGCDITLVEYKEENSWLPDIEDFKKSINEHTKMILLNNPSNPTGCLLDESYLKELIELCQSKSIYILCDEVYRGFHDQTSISDLYEYGISTASLSKVFALAGLRFGWVKASKEVIHQINVRRDYSMISTGPLIDHLANVALMHKDELIQRHIDLVQTNKKIVSNWLSHENRFSIQLPKNGTVGFLKYHFDMDSETFAKRLLSETGIFFVPGSCFDYEYHVRLGLGQDSKVLEQGLDILSNWTDRNIV